MAAKTPLGKPQRLLVITVVAAIGFGTYAVGTVCEFLFKILFG